MANYDLTVNQGAQPSEGGQRLIAFERIVKFADQNVLATDTVDLIDVPGNIKIIAARANVITVEGATLTFDVGIKGVAADTLIDGANGNTADLEAQSGDGTNDNLLAADGYKVPAAGATVQMLANNNAATAVIRIQVTAIDMRNMQNDPAA